jgi:hypothetical protein
MRIRTIKPEFWSHPVIGRLADAEKLMAIGLLNVADDDGYFLADETLIRNAIRPFDESSTNTRRALEALSKAGWIAVREHPEQGKIGLVVNFSKHQRIDRPSASKIACYYNSTSPRRALDEPSLLEGKGKEGKGTGKGMDGASPNGSPVSVEATEEAKPSEPRSRFKPPTREELNLEAAKIGLPDVEVDKFVAHYGANGWKVGKNPMKSWSHALAGWAARWRENYGNHATRQRTGGPDLNAHVSGAGDRFRERREQWANEDADAPPPGFDREPDLAVPGLRPDGNPSEG